MYVLNIDNCLLIFYDQEKTGLYKHYRYEDYTFVFKFDERFPELLHIYVRHLKTPEDAIEVWFEGDDFWNQEFQRFETSTETKTVYWYWIRTDKVIMVVSCFDKQRL